MFGYFAGKTVAVVAKDILTFLLVNWRYVVLAILVAAVWWKWHSLHATISSLQETNTSLVARNASLEVAATQLNHITQQNDQAVRRLTQLNQEMVAQFGRLDADNRQRQREFSQALDRIRSQSAPKTDRQAVDYLITNSNELRGDTK